MTFIFVFSLITQTSFSKELYWKKYNIKFSGITEKQLSLIEETVNHLKSLGPKELKVKKKMYKKLSRFGELFGFSFNGKDLFHWLLSRTKKFVYRNSWTVAVNQNKGEFILGDEFFNKVSMLERLYVLMHEARHSDNGGYKHIRCPKDFKFISAGSPDMMLENEPACDDSKEGAYSYQAAFLFELFAFRIFDQKETGLTYNSSIARVIP